jgi:hypothetical protein
MCIYPVLKCSVEVYTVTRRKVKFPYIHMMTPDDNGPRRENISRMRAGKIPALLRRFLTLPEFSRDMLHEKSEMPAQGGIEPAISGTICC